MTRKLLRPHEKFFIDSMERIMREKRSILDIGGGLRLSTEHSNRADSNHAWLAERIAVHGIRYRVLDYVDTYHPDIVGDIQKLSLTDGSEEAIVCLSVLEHVENPFLAASEIHRVLKPGGYCFINVPFLFYYHAERGYYQDYWRFTEDSLRALFKNFSSIDIRPMRGAIETLIRLSPLGRHSFFCDIGFLLDRASGKTDSKQTSGYQLFLVK